MAKRTRRAILIVGIGLAVVVLGPALVNLYVGFYTDWLWFQSLGHLSTYRTRLLAEVGTFLLGGLAALAFLGVNWLLVPRRLLRHLQLVIRPRQYTLRIGSRVFTGEPGRRGR